MYTLPITINHLTWRAFGYYPWNIFSKNDTHFSVNRTRVKLACHNASIQKSLTRWDTNQLGWFVEWFSWWSMKGPRPCVVCPKSDGDIVSNLADDHYVTNDRVFVVRWSASCASDDEEVMLKSIEVWLSIVCFPREGISGARALLKNSSTVSLLSSSTLCQGIIICLLYPIEILEALMTYLNCLYNRGQPRCCALQRGKNIRWTFYKL